MTYDHTRVSRGRILIKSMDAEKLPFQLESRLFGLSHTKARRGRILIESMDAEKVPLQLKSRFSAEKLTFRP